MDFKDKLKAVTIRIKCRGLKGSGVLFQTEGNSERVFVVTAKHNILGESGSNGATVEDIKISKFKNESKEYELILDVEDELIHIDGKDLSLISIDRKKLGNKQEVPIIKMALIDDYIEDCFFRGYPRFGNNKVEKSGKGTVDLLDSDENFHHLILHESFLRYYENREIEISVKGFSGSGIFAHIDDELFLIGIVNKFSLEGRFKFTITECLSPYFKIYNFGVEKFLPASSCDQKLKKALLQLKPRYSESNLKLAIEKDFDQFVGNDEYVKFLHEFFNFNFRDVNQFILDTEGILSSFLKKHSSVSYGPKNVLYKEKIDELINEMQDFVAKAFNLAKNPRDQILVDGLLDQAKSSFENFSEFINVINKGPQNNAVVRLLQNNRSILRAVRDSEQSLKRYAERIILLKGDAGQGKSQLLGYLAQKWLNNAIPCYLLLGQSLSDEVAPWDQIMKQVSDRDCTETEFLDLLNMKGKICGNPVVIFIDAINEGRGIPLWNKHFSSFVESLQRYEWVKVILSYRTIYERALFDGISLDGLKTFVHWGFKGHEKQAIKFFFEEAKLPVPSLPKFSENFANPLFLKLFVHYYKKSLGRSNFNNLISLSEVFRNFFSYVNNEIGARKQTKYDSERLNLVDLSIRHFVAKLSEQDDSYINYMDAFVLIEQAVGVFLNNKGFLRSLIDENVFSESVYYIEEDSYEYGVTFAYQKLGDFLLARHLLDGKTFNELKAQISSKKGKIYKYLDGSDFAEQNVGVLESLCVQISEKFKCDIFDVSTKFKNDPFIIGAFVNSLSDRKPGEIREVTNDHLKRILKEKHVEAGRIWDRILGYLFEPGNSLDANFLNGYLSSLKLNERDASWTIYLQDYESRKYHNEISTILDIGRKYGIEDPELQIDKLALVKVIGWFLGSANRMLRDDASLVLILIFRNDLSLLLPFVKNFESVNDYYILQRVYGVVLGSIICADNKAALPEIAKYVFKQVFDKEYVVPDILLRDYARIALEYCLFRFPDIDIPKDKFSPPYRSKTIKKFPTNEEIAQIPKSMGYDSSRYHGIGKILDSMITEHSGRGMYGDFGRYVFGSAFKNWKELDDDQLSNVAILMIVEKYGYDKYLSDYDANMTSRSRNPEKIERIGKKYQWMAFHELLAIVSDHYNYFEPWYVDKDPVQFQGPWESYIRDFDPTYIIPSNVRLNQDQFPFFKYEIDSSGNDNEWIKATSDLPSPEELISYIDVNGIEWLVLETSKTWNDTNDYASAKRTIWYQVRSYLTKKKDHRKIVKWMSNQNLMGRWMPESLTDSQKFLGEFFWSPSILHNDKEDIWEGIRNEDGVKVADVVVTAHNYLNEKSIEGSKSLLIPGNYLFHILELEHSIGDGTFRDKTGQVVAYDPSVLINVNSCLLVNKKVLLTALKKNNLNIFWTVLGEKQVTIVDKENGKREYLMPTQLSMILTQKEGSLSHSSKFNIQ